jgi:uncharacterized membrane protein YeaQ/YmgE (transglycosylase-associated protein family)
VILLFLLVWGMAAGYIAHWLLDRGHRVNWADMLIAGLVGSFLGGLVVSLLAGDGLALKPSGLIGSVLGAIVVLAIVGSFRRKRLQEQRAAAKKAARSGRHLH